MINFYWNCGSWHNTIPSKCRIRPVNSFLLQFLMKRGHDIFPIWSFSCFALRVKWAVIPSKFSLRSILNWPNQKCISHTRLKFEAVAVKTLINHNFSVFTIKFSRLVMKTFKRVVLHRLHLTYIYNQWRHKGISMSRIWKRCSPALRTFSAWTMAEM